jgi:hypothetical protein
MHAFDVSNDIILPNRTRHQLVCGDPSGCSNTYHIIKVAEPLLHFHMILWHITVPQHMMILVGYVMVTRPPLLVAQIYFCTST